MMWILFYFSHFWQKQNDIYSFKLIEYIRINIAKNVNDESANKLTTPKLIAYNGKMPIKSMMKSKSLIESVIDWNWSFNKNQTNTATRCEIKQRRSRRRTTQHRTQTMKLRKKLVT